MTKQFPPDPRRKARFREIARGIVAKDRSHRKYGLTVDTGGAIAQALERAYRDGVRDGPAALAPAPEQSETGPVEWALIPPRPREGFWSICLAILGGDSSRSRDGHLAPALTERGTPGWAIVTEGRNSGRVIGERSVASSRHADVRLLYLDRSSELDRCCRPKPEGRGDAIRADRKQKDARSTRMGIGLVVDDQDNPDRRGFLSHLHCLAAARYRVDLVLLCCGAVRCSRGAAENSAASKPHRGGNARPTAGSTITRIACLLHHA